MFGVWVGQAYRLHGAIRQFHSPGGHDFYWGGILEIRGCCLPLVKGNFLALD